ncbi:MAG: radical SAM protein [Acidobacteriota bacterium]|jgi:radical SAM superfamily enzyme YgiQ (UPF0313 family)|nr:radical SAM protein [Acidobacteriota bacterium]
MRVQLFVPPQGYIAQRWSEGSSMPPLGILYLTAVLEADGHEVDVVPADVLEFSWDDVRRRIETFQPQVVGVTTTTENRFDSFRLLETAKGVDPRIVTVLGGPHISMAGEETLRDISSADVLVIGEGEITLSEMLRALAARDSLLKVPGLYVRDNGQIRFTGKRTMIADLDSLPFPARERIPMDRYRFSVSTTDGRERRAQNIMTSRGCPFNCYFCATPINWGRKVRGHSPERVLSEIEWLIDRYGAEFIWFYDDTLNYNPRRLHRIMDMIIERRLNIRFSSEFRIDVVDRPLLEKMRRAGLERGYFGVEAGASRVRQEVVLKQFDIERAFDFVHWAKELDFIPGPFFIFSHYTETWPEAQETLRIMDRMRDIHPQVDISTAILHVYPGTPLEGIARERGIIPGDFHWSRRRDMRKVPTLPAAQGQVPLFKDQLTWWQIAKLVMGFTAASNKGVSRRKWVNAIKSLSSFRNLYAYGVFFAAYIYARIRRLCGRPAAFASTRK